MIKKETFFVKLNMEENGTLNYIESCEIREFEKMKFSSFDEFFDFIAGNGKKTRNANIYVHDLEYNGKIIVAYLSTQKKANLINIEEKSYDGDIKVIASRGSWYKVSLIYKKKKIHIMDSKKIIPFEIDDIRENLHIKNIDDVLVMSEAIKQVGEYGLTEKLTIGSCCMNEFKELQTSFDSLFPVIDDDTDAFLRESYMGGWMYTKPSIMGKSQGEGYVYDANSLYPSQMKTKEFPIKQPNYFDGSDFEKYENRIYIVHFSACITLKKKHFPFIYAPAECTKDDQGYLITTDMECMEFVLTKPDFELMFEQYEVDDLTIIDGYWFKGRQGIFNSYIEKWYNIKKNAKSPVERLIAKLMLNNLYGKFGTDPKTFQSIPYIDSNNEFRMRQEEVRVKTVYVPVAAFVTAYGRQETIRKAQMHYDDFLYSDTDSIHSKKELTDIPIGKELGEWKCENKFSMAKYLKAKTYIEKMIEKDGIPCDPYWTVKAAGASDYSKQLFLADKTDDEIMKQFKIGLKMVGNYKKKTVHNTVIMEEFTFKIK